MNYYSHLDTRELLNLADVQGTGLPPEAIGQILDTYESEDELAESIGFVFELLEDGELNVLQCLLRIAKLTGYDLDLEAVRENMVAPAASNGA